MRHRDAPGFVRGLRRVTLRAARQQDRSQHHSRSSRLCDGYAHDGCPRDRPDVRIGPPPGFGRTVSDYLNHFVTVADTKAGAFLAASLTVGAATARMSPASSSGRVCQVLALAAFGSSVSISALAVFPRLPRAARGVLFWEDIKTRSGPAEYERDVAGLDNAAVESEYAEQNFFVSRLLHTKFRCVRGPL